MNESFSNALGFYCAFTDDGIITKQLGVDKGIYFPYGSIESISTFVGLTIKSYNGDGFSYAWNSFSDRRKIKKLVRNYNKKKNTYNRENSYEIALDNETIEKSKSKIKLFQESKLSNAIAIIIILILFIIAFLLIGNLTPSKQDGYRDDKGNYHDTEQERDNWNDVWDWMDENW